MINGGSSPIYEGSAPIGFSSISVYVICQDPVCYESEKPSAQPLPRKHQPGPVSAISDTKNKKWSCIWWANYTKGLGEEGSSGPSIRCHAGRAGRFCQSYLREFRHHGIALLSDQSAKWAQECVEIVPSQNKAAHLISQVVTWDWKAHGLGKSASWPLSVPRESRPLFALCMRLHHTIPPLRMLSRSGFLKLL